MGLRRPWMRGRPRRGGPRGSGGIVTSTLLLLCARDSATCLARSLTGPALATEKIRDLQGKFIAGRSQVRIQGSGVPHRAGPVVEKLRSATWLRGGSSHSLALAPLGLHDSTAALPSTCCLKEIREAYCPSRPRSGRPCALAASAALLLRGGCRLVTFGISAWHRFRFLAGFGFLRHSSIYFVSLAPKFRTGHLESQDYARLPTCPQTGRAAGCCRRSVQRVATRAATLDHFPRGPALKLRAHPGFPRRLVGTG